ncbi:MAG: hypothetical protein QOE28_2186 [Solirubrobacteraceae bacterium]|nr:hypothetical protein [Solirubrobacteraceae bacterium]
MIRRFAKYGAVVALAAGAAPAAASGPPPGRLAPVHGTYAPTIDPARFIRTIDNPYLPYLPGTTIRFRGQVDGAAQTDVEVVLHSTRRILGVRTTIVRDTVFAHGTPIERTDDYYAQDRDGNVWYMGEDAFDRVHGRFAKAPDSWLGGVHGAEPGIIMPAHPRVGDRYRQEYYPPGKALDEGRVIRTGGHRTVPAGSYDGVLVTAERSPAEPAVERKYYVRGVGEIADRLVKGGHESFQLVRVTRARR